ncbi:MAG: hypothetical protein K2M30_03990 [Desulfovibrionaceae bacterium]|nr:hypothetical protein [Desulfovibrionaceae bacterium]
MAGINIVFISITIMFFMFFIWLCTLSIRLSIAYKLIVKLYQETNMQYIDEEYENTTMLKNSSTISLPPLPSVERKPSVNTPCIQNSFL